MSSDEDIPLRQRNQAFLLGKAKPVVLDSSDDDSPLPSWLKNHQSPAQKGGPPAIQSDSDTDIKEIISPIKLLSPLKKPQETQETEDEKIQLAAPPAAKPASQPKPPSASKIKKPTPAKKKGTQVGTASALKTFAPPAGPSSQHQTTQETAGPSGRPATSAAAIAANLPSFGGGILAPSSSLPVMIPDKLSQVKVLLELESTDEVHGATDLSGDSGAIGRIMLTGQPGSQQVQADLKGVLYNATIVPCPVTMAVVNIGQTEAKVECLFSEYVQLREDSRFSEVMGDGVFGGLLGDEDDDEHYDAADGDGGDREGGSGAKKKAENGKGRAKSAADKKPRGGVGKKPAVRAKPKAKPKAKSRAKK